MMDHLLNLELPADHEHPPAPLMKWDDYVAWVDAHQRALLASGRYAQFLPDFAETHKGEPFVLHGD
jgi:hypothetical protein